jgi:hydrogenase-4 component B
VALAANGILFLFGWEVMALAAFVAVGTEDHLEEARRASYLYLVTTRIGTLCLFAMFVLMHRVTGHFAFVPLVQASPELANAIFVLAVVGFGFKAGLMPFHIWLPPAHAAAPSHVSAMMSGVMIKIGIYGLLRVLSLLPTPPVWWALVLLGLGSVSGVLGVVFAIAQHDLKRLLAYHSVENIGIIVLGVGLAVLGRALGHPELVVLGVAGALLHTWNHGLFKGLLFLSAGAVIHATCTRQIDRLGGLLRTMPRVAVLFLLASAAISGLPPLNGFVSELLVYLGLFRATAMSNETSWSWALLSLGALALIGGLALACFAKVFGAVFLGQPRSSDTARAHDAGGLMIGPMATLGAACLLIGIVPRVASVPIDHAARTFIASALPSLGTLAPLTMLTVTALAVVALCVIGGAFLWRRSRAAAAGPTWDCGYAAPSARMQYTASSFAEILVGIFGGALRPRGHVPHLKGFAPAPSRFESHVDDTFLERAYRPATTAVANLLRRFSWLQPGHVHLYLLYVVATLIALLVWTQGVAR